MKSSRQRIIDYLQDHRAGTAAEISRILNLTAADVRHHIAILQKQRCITTIGHCLTQQRGRPARIFTLREPASRNNLDILSHHLLSALSTSSQNDNNHATLRDLARIFAKKATWDKTNITHSIYHTVKYLKDLNYDASWEAHARSPHLILRHCPYATIIEQHPELCYLDACLIENLLGMPVQQVEKLNRSIDGLRQCKFIVQKGPGTKDE